MRLKRTYFVKWHSFSWTRSFIFIKSFITTVVALIYICVKANEDIPWKVTKSEHAVEQLANPPKLCQEKLSSVPKVKKKNTKKTPTNMYCWEICASLVGLFDVDTHCTEWCVYNFFLNGCVCREICNYCNKELHVITCICKFANPSISQ